MSVIKEIRPEYGSAYFVIYPGSDLVLQNISLERACEVTAHIVNTLCPGDEKPIIGAVNQDLFTAIGEEIKIEGENDQFETIPVTAKKQ